MLVYYDGIPELGILSKWGIAYYHYDPPFDGPHWTDFNNHDRTPAYWWPLPSPPNTKVSDAPH